MTPLQARLGPARLPFLLLTLSCVSLGAALAWHHGQVGPHFTSHVLIALIGGVAAHVSVNALNEYVDFQSGLDQMTQRTPFSGGSGALPARPDLAPYVLSLGVISLLVAAGIGLFFVMTLPQGQGPLLVIGLLGLILVVAYTPWVTRLPWLCLASPGLGFGPVMIMGTQLALSGQSTWQAFVASVLPFFVVSNLLLLNQVPDIEPDRQAGRLTLPMVLGVPATVSIMGAQWGLGFGSVALFVALGWLPDQVLSVLILCPLAGWAWWRLRRYAQRGLQSAPPCMAVNVVIAVVSPLVLAVALWLT